VSGAGRQDDERESRILAVAREYVGIDRSEIDVDAAPDERIWRSGDAGAVRRHFVEVVGRADLPDLRPARASCQITMGSAGWQVSGVVRTKGELAMALRAFGEDPAVLNLGPGSAVKIEVNGTALTSLADVMPERRPPRRREKESLTIARTLTLHYLSRAGGGTRTLSGAASLWEAQSWRLPASWTSAHYRTLEWIRETLGAV
jgi:hypothetical protein